MKVNDMKTMKMMLTASALALSLNVMAETPTINVKILETTPMVVVDQGLGCVNFDDMRGAYMNRNIMIELLQTHRCFVVEPGEEYQVVDGSYRDDVVNLYYNGSAKFAIPAFVFGEDAKFK
jgi:DNA-binding LacI/PurR family transcriptional regulator